MLTKILIGVALYATCLEGTLWATAEPSWTSLRVTWGMDLLDPKVFAILPRTESEARSEGFVKLPGDCSGGKFLGTRYIKDNKDTAVVLLFDSKAYIAGIQNGLPKKDVEKIDTAFSFTSSSAYQLDTIGDQEIYFLTTYFVDPSIICTKGRTKEDLDEQGTGTGLYIQSGTDPIKDSKMIPLYEDGMKDTRWIKGGCFPTMGQHYWYDATEDMDCTKFFPYTMIFHEGKLNSFAFASIGIHKFSTRFEYPPQNAITKFFPTPAPRCLDNEFNHAGGFSTMHVYFNLRPWEIKC